MENTNIWSLYIGVAIEDRPYDSGMIKVHCHEILPFVDKELKDLTLEEVVNIVDNTNQDAEDEVTIKTTNVINADYFDMVPNFSFPPFIKKGERVFVLRYRDSDKYYWLPIGMDKHLHTPEIFRLFVSDLKEGGDMTEENTYSILLDTLFTKRIKFQTSNKDGEKFVYTILIDAKNNIMSFNDDDERMIIIDSNDDTILLKNKAGSLVTCKADNTYVYATKDVSIQAEENVSIAAKKTIALQATEIIFTDAEQKSTTTINQEGTFIESKKTVIDGDVTISGKVETFDDVTVAGKIQASKCDC